jgi:hypothetical protein
MAVKLLPEIHQAFVFLRCFMVNSVSGFELQGIYAPFSAWSQMFSSSCSDGPVAHLEPYQFVLGLLFFK